MSSGLSRIFLETCVLIALGSLVGLSLNYQLVVDAFTGNLTAMPQKSVVEGQAKVVMPQPILIDEVQGLGESEAVLVDARSLDLFNDGHLPGAVPLPLETIEHYLGNFLRSVPRNQTIVVYCSGYGCPDSFDLGMLLLSEGYLDVRVFEGGFPEWRDAGLPTESSIP